MSSMKYCLCFGMLGCAGIYAAVCAYKFYSSNKSENIPRSNGEVIIPNEIAKIKLDVLFIFYAENKNYFRPVRSKAMEFSADEALKDWDDGSSLSVRITKLYEHRFNITTDGPLKYEGMRLYIADPKHEEHYYGKADDLQEIDLNSAAIEVLQRSKDLFALAENLLVILKLFYVLKQN